MSLNVDVKSSVKKLYQLMKDLKLSIKSCKDINSAQAHLGGILNDLEVVVSTTELEVEKILSQVEILNTIASTSPAEIKNQLNQAVQAICEACCFQDINGQRITRVVTSLAKISEYFTYLEKNASTNSHGEHFSFCDKNAKNELLQGPKAPSDVNQQELADSFFDSKS